MCPPPAPKHTGFRLSFRTSHVFTKYPGRGGGGGEKTVQKANVKLGPRGAGSQPA